MIPHALLDANVLLSRTLRDWLFLFKIHTRGNAFTLICTEDILAETAYRFRRNHPQAHGAVVARLMTTIRRQLDDVLQDFPAPQPFWLEDRDDAHVHGAASTSAISHLVTADRGFLTLESTIRSDLTYVIDHPDSFLLRIGHQHEDAARHVLEEQRAYWQLSPDSAANEVLGERLVQAGCPRFGSWIQELL